MHPRESASGERCPRPPLGIPAWEKLPDAPTAAAPHTRLHRLRTALKASHRLRLPRPLFWGGCKYGTSLHHEDASDTVSPTEVRQRPRTQCKKQGRFYLLAEPFRCPTIGEPLKSAPKGAHSKLFIRHTGFSNTPLPVYPANSYRPPVNSPYNRGIRMLHIWPTSTAARKVTANPPK